MERITHFEKGQVWPRIKKEQPRTNEGKYSNKNRMRKWEKRILTMFAIGAAVYLLGVVLVARVTPPDIIATAHADVVATTTPEYQGLTVAQLEDKLDVIVWGGESKKYLMDDGEMFPTFDPTAAMYQRCIQVGGKQPKDCLSYGPRQEKIGTIEYYWPKFHDGAKISDKDARAVAESNDESKRFFLDCAVQVKGCADNWTTFAPHKDQGQVYIDLIRQVKGIQI